MTTQSAVVSAAHMTHRQMSGSESLNSTELVASVRRNFDVAPPPHLLLIFGPLRPVLGLRRRDFAEEPAALWFWGFSREKASDGLIASPVMLSGSPTVSPKSRVTRGCSLRP